MHERLSVHTVGFGPVGAGDFVADLAEQGIKRVGMQVRQLETGGLATNLSAVRDAGVEIVDLVVPDGQFTLEDESGWPAQRDHYRACVDVAAEAGVPVLYTTTGRAPSLTWDEAADRLVNAFHPVVEYARAAGVTLALENTSSMRADLGFVHGIHDLTELTTMAGMAPYADLCAAWNERGLEQTIRESASTFVMAQLGDLTVETICASDRVALGDGDLPLERQLSWLAAGGYQGLIEIEMLGPRITAEGPAIAAGRSVKYISALIDRIFG